MEENKRNTKSEWQQEGSFLPLVVSTLGTGTLLAGLAIPILSSISPDAKDQITSLRESFGVPALLIALGILFLCFYFLLKKLQNLHQRMGSLTENTFDREVASLLAALRPFAERLEERIGPVLTASQKLGKPLDAVHIDLQKQGEKLQEIVSFFEEMKFLLARCREDFNVVNRGKALDPINKKLNDLTAAILSSEGDSSSKGKIPKSLTLLIAQLGQKQEELSKSIAALREEEMKRMEEFQAEISKNLSAATASAPSFPQLESEPGFASKDQPKFAEEPPTPPPKPTGVFSPEEKQSVKNAIEKLKQFRGG